RWRRGRLVVSRLGATRIGGRAGRAAPSAPRILRTMDRLAALLDFHRDDPDDPFTRFALAQGYLKGGDAEQALAYFEGLVQDHPDYVGTYYHLGEWYEALGRTESASAPSRAGVAAATPANDRHAGSELQGAVLAAEGRGFDDCPPMRFRSFLRPLARAAPAGLAQRRPDVYVVQAG